MRISPKGKSKFIGICELHSGLQASLHSCFLLSRSYVLRPSASNRTFILTTSTTLCIARQVGLPWICTKAERRFSLYQKQWTRWFSRILHWTFLFIDLPVEFWTFESQLVIIHARNFSISWINCEVMWRGGELGTRRFVVGTFWKFLGHGWITIGDWGQVLGRYLVQCVLWNFLSRFIGASTTVPKSTCVQCAERCAWTLFANWNIQNHLHMCTLMQVAGPHTFLNQYSPHSSRVFVVFPLSAHCMLETVQVWRARS